MPLNDYRGALQVENEWTNLLVFVWSEVFQRASRKYGMKQIIHWCTAPMQLNTPECSIFESRVYIYSSEGGRSNRYVHERSKTEPGVTNCVMEGESAACDSYESQVKPVV